MVSIVEAPYIISFSRNPVRYSLVTTTALTTPGLLIEVELVYKANFGNDPEQEIIRLPLIPDENGTVSVDFSKILDSLVEYELPDFTALISKPWKQLGQFYIRYREVTTATPDPAFTDDSTNDHFVIKGGLPYERWQGPNFFLNTDYAGKYWMSWQPTGKTITAWQQVFLTYFHTTDTVSDVKAKFTIYYTDGSTDNSFEIAFPENPIQYGLYRIPVGVEQLSLHLIDTNKQIHYYTVQVLAGTTPQIAAYKYCIDYTMDYNRLQLSYFNSIGALESVHMQSDYEPVIERTADIAEHNPASDYFNQENLAAQEFTQQVFEKITYKGNVGWMEDNNEQDILRDLLLSKGVHAPKFNRWWPVNILNKNMGMGLRAINLKDFEVEWTHGISNENYMPESLSMGGLPSCPVASNLQLTVEGDGDWTFTWTGDAAHQNYQLVLKVTYFGPPNSHTLVYYATGTTITITPNDLLWKSGNAHVVANCGYNKAGKSNTVTLPLSGGGV